MESYILNVLMSAAPFFVFGAWIVFSTLLVTVLVDLAIGDAKGHVKIARKLAFVAFLVSALFGLGKAMIAPSNTYKHEPHNKVELNTRIYQQTTQKSSAVVSDQTKQPTMTKEDRKARFSEMTKIEETE